MTKALFIKRFFNKLIDIILKIIDFIPHEYTPKLLRSLRKIIISLNAKVIFLVDGGGWAIDWVGKYITQNLHDQNLINAEITPYFYLKRKIVHFGSKSCLIGRKKGLIYSNKSNKIVATWFHVDVNDNRLRFIPLLNKKIDILHTSNTITKTQLIEFGFNEKKIVVIPLGVDLLHFKRYKEIKKNQLKIKYNLPRNKVIIGSFQKDGIGWGEGLEPKYVKGPDIFCEIVKKISKSIDVHILLTGPARGYVKKRLDDYKIPYTHIFLKNYLDIVECYNVLDLYLITSRAEGGPLALLEGMATGVPIVSNNVGMAPDIIKHGKNGYLCDIENINQFCEYSISIIKNEELREKIITNALDIVQKFSWDRIARQYYYKIYKKLLDR